MKILLLKTSVKSLSRAFSTKNILQPRHPLYLDSQSTSQLDFRVLDSMLPFMTSSFGNPHSSSHEYGWETEDAVALARK